MEPSMWYWVLFSVILSGKVVYVDGINPVGSTSESGNGSGMQSTLGPAYDEGSAISGVDEISGTLEDMESTITGAESGSASGYDNDADGHVQITSPYDEGSASHEYTGIDEEGGSTSGYNNVSETHVSEDAQPTSVPAYDEDSVHDGATVNSTLMVDIIVVHNARDDFPFPTPLYYQLTSSVTLFCHVHDASDAVNYYWLSTSTTFFAYNSTSQFNRKNILTSSDAGVHLCSVTDADGSTGYARTEMRFTGAEIYVAHSLNYNGVTVANNSMVRHPSSCHTCKTDFYCYSNSTSSDVGEIILPDGSIHHTKPVHREDFNVERLNHSGIHVQVYNLHVEGIYTCKLPDSSGNILDLSIGLYNDLPGPPSIDVSLSGYTDLTVDSTTSVLAIIQCYTTVSPPTSVMWKRNGLDLHIDGNKYEKLQTVSDHRNSHYRNTLLVKDVFGILGSVTYTCVISNSIGRVSHNITTKVSVKSKADIVYYGSPVPLHDGQHIALTCKGIMIPLIAISQLVPYMSIEWQGPDGISLTKQNHITIGVQHSTHTELTRTLTINGTSSKHSGFYTCQVVVDLPNSAGKLTSAAQYHLMILKNITVSSHDSPLVDGHPEDLLCMWCESSIPRMEWLFLSQGLIVPMEYTNNSWDEEMFTCMMASYDGVEHVESMTLKVKASMKNSLSIEASSDLPTARQNFTLTCTVISERPSQVMWIGPDGQPVNDVGTIASSQDIGTLNRSHQISFLPLHTSHGGLYTCISNITAYPSVHDSTLEYFIRVQIPPPTVTIIRETEEITQVLSLVCTVKHTPEVDTPVTVNVQWHGPSSHHDNNRFNISRADGPSPLYKSFFNITPPVWSDSGLYTCTANVVPEVNSSVYRSPWTNEELSISVPLNVSIQITYNPPSDFTLSTPPYYRPASSVTFTCIIQEATYPTSFHWSSTSASSFVHNQITQSVTKNILTSTDAGVHTCTVTDAAGNTGHSSTEMKMFGAGIYVEHSQYISYTSVPNNAAIKLSCDNCQLAFYCYSNLTSTYSYPYIIFPSGSTVSSQSSYYNNIGVRRVNPFGIHLEYAYRRYTSIPAGGIYTCKFRSSRKQALEISIGIYFRQAGSLSIHSNTYTDLTEDNSNTTLAIVECNTRGSLPTNVTWQRNGVKINLNNAKYEVVQIMTNRRYSHYQNKLIVRDVFGALGNLTYNCMMTNFYGTVSQSVHFEKAVAEIIALSQPFYGNKFVLSCRTTELLLGQQNSSDIVVHLEWYGPNGIMTAEENDINLGMQHITHNVATRNITFNYLTLNHNGTYTCLATAYITNSLDRLLWTAQYHLDVASQLSITGLEVPMLSGLHHDILCTWNGGIVAKMDWYLEGLDKIPVKSVTNTSVVVLSPEPSATGLNGTTFTCKATTLDGVLFEEAITLQVKSLRVSILVTYRAPPDFTLPAPPYYRPASSVTLSCITHDATHPVSYHWSSTNTASFVHNQTSKSITKNILTSSDAGVHTCTVTDADGNVVHTRTKMEVVGAGIYVEKSQHIINTPVANNTAVQVKVNYCYNCRIAFSCYSNVTAKTSRTTIVFPNGNEYSSSSYYMTVQLVGTAGIRVHSKSSRTPEQGIYTCRIPGSDGSTLDMSIGIYTYSPRSPIIYESNYTDLTENTNVSALALIRCSTRNSPPTTMLWKRNNVTVDLDGDRYETIQIVTNRYYSQYQNILIVSDALGLVGNFTYTCHISNMAGGSTESIHTSVAVEPMVEITALSEAVYKAHFVLMCEVHVTPKLYTQLVPYMVLEWLGPDGVTLTEENSISLGMHHNCGKNLACNITFNQLNITHNGIYSCQVNIRLQSATITRTTGYDLRVKAITITGNETPLINGLSGELMCTWNEGNASKIEWLSNVLLSVAYNTKHLPLTVDVKSSLHGTTLTCRVTIQGGIVFEEDVIVEVKELTNNASIQASSDVLTAGEDLTLTCTVVSDRPPHMRWIGSDGEQVSGRGITVSPQITSGLISTLQLVFEPLRTSHGGTYTCISSVNTSSGMVNATDEFLVGVQIPPPLATIVREPKGHIEILSEQILKCMVEVIRFVDTPIVVATEWTLPPSLQNDSRSTVTVEEGHHPFFSSSVVIDAYTFNHSGNYTCRAKVTPNLTFSDLIYESVWASDILEISTSLNVSILVTYNPPSDFILPSPPYYRPATSVTLTCVTHGNNLPTTYVWSSTCTDCFISKSKPAQAISRSILTATDAGIHTCTAIDTLGNTGNSSTEMKIVGIGIYVQHSQYISSASVANNTAVEMKTYTCRNCRRLAFFCYSNSTTGQSVLTLVSPNGRAADANMRVDTISPSIIHVYNNAYYSNPQEGIYTCKTTDSTGGDMSIGVYNTPRLPSLNRSEYQDLTQDISSTALAILRCITDTSPPTTVTWKRDGMAIGVDGDKYETVQIVTDRRQSQYHNTLVVNIVTEILGSPTYTCVITNSAGEVSYDIHTDISISVEVEAEILTSSQPAIGKDLVLTCKGRFARLRSLLTSQVIHYVHLEWKDFRGAPITEGDNVFVDEVSHDTFSRTLSFNPLGGTHDKVYTCLITIDIPNTDMYFSTTTQHRIILNTAFFQLKFDFISCTELYTDQNVAGELENNIKHTLTDAINKNCSCGFLTSMIDQGEFNCLNTFSITYRARIVGGGDTRSASQLIHILQDWMSNDGTVLYTYKARVRVWADPLCPLEIESLHTQKCDTSLLGT